MTKIEWVARPGTRPESWNFIAGCTKASPGCDNCYALRDSWRIVNSPNHPDRYDGVVGLIVHDDPGAIEADPGRVAWTGCVNVDEQEIERPLRWQKRRTVFVCSMADLFHPAVPDEAIEFAFDIMIEASQHTFQVLTKRAERMRRFLDERLWGDMFPPESNIWLGVTAENQHMANERIPHLLQTPASVQYLSVEPMLGPIDLEEPYPNREIPDSRGIYYPWVIQQLDWVIIGGESGPGAREMELSWARDLIDQCLNAGVPVFVKQLGTVWARKYGGPLSRYGPEPGRKGENIEAWPKDLRVREWPR